MKDVPNVETALGIFNDLYRKYKFMDSNFAKSKEVYKSKIPEIERTLEIINLLKSRGEEETDGVITSYSLCDTIYAKAKVFS